MPPKKKATAKGAKTRIKKVKKIPSKKIVIEAVTAKKDYKGLVQRIRRNYRDHSPMPHDLKPMLTTIIPEPFNDRDWTFEIKWDGYRALAYVNEGTIELRSRNNLPFNDKYPSIVEALQKWPVNAVLDGEVVVLNEQGKTDFNGLQYWKQRQQGQLLYYVFDLLWLDGIDLTKEPLVKRKELLKKILPDAGPIRYSDDIEEFGIDLFQAAKTQNLEGIIAKKKDSLYNPGARTQNWYKIKAEKRHEAVICGYTRKKDTDRLFSSLVLGMYQGKELIFIGQVGTGWNAAMQKDLLKQMKPLQKAQSPFSDVPPTNAETVWLQPQLVCEVKYTELTKEGIMRHPSFQGLRDDKKAAEVQLANDIIIPKKRNLKQHKWFHPG